MSLDRFPTFLFIRLLENLDWPDRSILISLNKKLNGISKSDSFFMWCCERLALENGIYVLSDKILLTGESWKARFLELFPLRNMWSPDHTKSNLKLAHSYQISDRHDEDKKSPKKFKINVFARFRPKSASNIDIDENASTTASVNLPLHQRLALIKMSNNLNSNKSALKILSEEGKWFSNNGKRDPSFYSLDGVVDSETSLEPICDDENIEVIGNGSSNVNGNSQKEMVASIQLVDSGTKRVVVLAPEVGFREFIFDGVFSQDTTQKYFYDASVSRQVMDFMNGFNSTTIVFGQTGSGKTYSMFGPEDAESAARGIIPRACVEILSAMIQRERTLKISSKLCVSYVEIFGDQIFDLLKGGAPCGQSKVAAQRYVLSGAAEQEVANLHDIEDVLSIGDKQKRFAATAMNERSSRAHTVFILSIEQTKHCYCKSDLKQTSLTKKSKFFFADLGGSEQVKKSLVEHKSGNISATGFEKGDRMREAIYINLGLLALKKCVDAINTRANYVPFQESKLTMLLSEGLGGNCKTSIVVSASMDNQHALETLSTLRFGEKCACLELEAHSHHQTMLESVLADLDHRIKDCEQQIRVKERWEIREEVRQDELAEANTVEAGQGGKEFKKVSVLLGAEEERKLLVQLLNKKASITASQVTSNLKLIAAHSKSKVIGFGKQYADVYDIGSEFDPEADTHNERFADDVEESLVPERVRARGLKQWSSSTAGSAAGATEKKANRHKLGYAGLS